jgi:FlaA1/EpsC-like NDP-sugar epimerase
VTQGSAGQPALSGDESVWGHVRAMAYREDDAAGRVAQSPQPAWLRQRLHLLLTLDALAMIAATWLAKLVSVGPGPDTFHIRSLEIPYISLALLTTPTWLIVLGTSRTYDLGPFGTIRGELRRVVSAAAHFLALIAVAYYVVHLDRLGRGFLIAIIPLATAFTVFGRWAARGLLRLQRTRGQAMRRAILLGPRRQTRLLASHLLTHPGAGVVPVAALVPGSSTTLPTADHEVPIIGTPDDALDALGKIEADVLLITASLAPGELRKLTWQLEGSGVDVLVAPTVGRLTWPQLDVRPVAGLPLLYVDRTDAGPRPATG